MSHRHNFANSLKTVHFRGDAMNHGGRYREPKRPPYFADAAFFWCGICRQLRFANDNGHTCMITWSCSIGHHRGVLLPAGQRMTSHSRAGPASSYGTVVALCIGKVRSQLRSLKQHNKRTVQTALLNISV